MLTEIQTRPVPYEQIEITFARNRPFMERPPVPQPGDQVFYRAEYWDQDPFRAQVIEVQDLNDKSDPNLWQQVRDGAGSPIVDGGVPRFSRVSDPWPWVRLEYEVLMENGHWLVTKSAVTRESRMRGSPGWLPLNWRTRPVRLPAELRCIERPSLRPVNVPLSQFLQFGG